MHSTTPIGKGSCSRYPTDLWGGIPEFYTPHDISPDGSRFIMMRRVAGDSAAVRMIVVENFAEELKARARRP